MPSRAALMVRSRMLMPTPSSIEPRIASIGFAAVYGWGVMASILPVAIYQGAFTAGAAAVEPLFTDEVLAVLGATGSLLVLAIGMKLLDIVHIRIVNLLPALFIAPVVAGVLENVG
jgi:uncharacterized protein